MARDPYGILEVGRSAPLHEVRAAYWSLARRYHPDGRTPDCTWMAEVNAAYEEIERERRRPAERPGLIPTGPGLPAAPPTDPTARAAGPVPAPVPAPGRSGPAPSPAPSAAPGSLLWRINAARHLDTPMLDFGTYAGWRIAEVAQHDPRYLRWLSRHSMGMRYRKAIEDTLGPDAEIGRRAAIVT